MTFVPADNTALVRLRYLYDEQECFNTLYVQVADSSVISSLAALANAAFDWWDANMAALTGIGVSLEDVEAVDLNSDTGPVYLYVPPAPSQGQIVGGCTPNNASFATSFVTAGRGRSSRGRNFFVGVPKGVVTESEVSAAWASDVRDAYSLLLGGTIWGVDATWVVISRFSGKDADGKPVPRPTAIIQPVVSVKTVDLVVDSMRRRLPKRGK